MSLKKPVRRQRFWTPLRIASTLLATALLASLGLASCNSREETPATNKPNAGPARANTLPPNVLEAELRSLSGQPIKLSDYSGKVLVLNVWATWCGPCRSEIPELVKLYKEFRGQGLEVVGLSTENPDASINQVREFVRAYNMDYPVGWMSQDVAVTLLRDNGNIPQSFIIARDGRVIRRFIGFSMANTPPQLRKAIEDALKT